MSRHFLLKTVSVVIACMFCMSASANHSWNNYHWARTTSFFTLKVVDSVTPDSDGVLNSALTKWSVSTVLDLEIAGYDDSRRSRKRCPMVKGQLRVCNDSYGLNGWLGLATIGIDSDGHIDRGTAKLNDSYASYWTIPGFRNHVMCQEIGHLFGLGHTSEDGSSQETCMDYSQSLASEWPNDHDYAQLELIYAQLDLYDSYDGADSGSVEEGGGGNCNAPAGKGCNKSRPVGEPPMGIRVSRIDDSEIWVAPRSDGGLWIHHVRLVPEG